MTSNPGFTICLTGPAQIQSVHLYPHAFIVRQADSVEIVPRHFPDESVVIEDEPFAHAPTLTDYNVVVRDFVIGSPDRWSRHLHGDSPVDGYISSDDVALQDSTSHRRPRLSGIGVDQIGLSGEIWL